MEYPGNKEQQKNYRTLAKTHNFFADRDEEQIDRLIYAYKRKISLRKRLFKGVKTGQGGTYRQYTTYELEQEAK